MVRRGGDGGEGENEVRGGAKWDIEPKREVRPMYVVDAVE